MIKINDIIESVRKEKAERVDEMVGPGYSATHPPKLELDEYLLKVLAAIGDQLNRIEMKLDGICPGCLIKPKPPAIRDVDGSFPAWSAKQRELGLNPINGHKLGCPEAS